VCVVSNSNEDNFFLRCGVVIVLSLLAGGTISYAQSNPDSNVVFQCGDNNTPPIVCYCQFIYHPHILLPGDTINQAESMPIDFNFHGSPNQQGLLFECSDTSYDAKFQIDTTFGIIRNLIVTYSATVPGPLMIVSTQNYTLDFDSLYYYHLSSDSIALHGDYLGNYHANVNGYDPNNSAWSGGGSDFGTDSIRLDLYLKLPQSSFVTDLPVFEQENLAFSYSEGGNSLIASFPYYYCIRKLTIFDQLGHVRFVSDVQAGMTSEEVSLNTLPPGCYFARLGDQVAKFVVPPR
jgi:hypothetical protein